MNDPTSPPVGFGSYLKSLRAGSGMSLRKVESKCAHVSSPLLHRLESGKVRDPSLHALIELAEVYGVSPLDMLANAGFDLREDTSRPNRRIIDGLEQLEESELDVLRTLARYYISRRSGVTRKT